MNKETCQKEIDSNFLFINRNIWFTEKRAIVEASFREVEILAAYYMGMGWDD